MQQIYWSQANQKLHYLYIYQPLFLLVKFSLLLSCMDALVLTCAYLLIQVESKSCLRAHSCALSNITTKETVQCLGFHSCGHASQITSSINEIGCDGSYSCFGSTLIETITSNITCGGLKSCANVSTLQSTNGSINCDGELSCANSIVKQVSGNFRCTADRCVSNSIIIGGNQHYISGHLGAYNATFINTPDIKLRILICNCCDEVLMFFIRLFCLFN